MTDFDTQRPLFKNARLTSLTRYLGARKKGKSGEWETRGTRGGGGNRVVSIFPLQTLLHSLTFFLFNFFPRRLLSPNGEFTS